MGADPPAAEDAFAPATAAELAATPAGSGRAAAAPVAAADEPAQRRTNEAGGEPFLQVLDFTGAPAQDVPVRWVDNDAGESWPTDAEGIARLPDLRQRLESAGGLARIWHPLPFATPPAADLKPQAGRGPRLESRLPPSGSLEVFVYEMDGQPAPDDTQVDLVLLGAETAGQWSAPLRQGRALFPYVEPGQQWEVRASHVGSQQPTVARGPGPAAGGHARLEIRIGSQHPVLRLRAVDAFGAPLVRTELDLEWRGDWLARSERLRSDDGGYFYVDDDGGGLFGASSVIVTERAADGAIRRGRKEIPADLPKGLHDGGDVVLLPEDVLVAGVVTDDAGTPIEGAHVSAGASPLVLFGEVGPSASSDAQGRFEIRGLLERDRFPVTASKDALRSETMEAATGERNLHLVLRPRHRVSGHLLLSEGVNPGALGLDLLAETGEGAEVDSASVDSTGNFGFDGVRTGIYSLRVRSERSTLAEVGPFRVDGDTDVGTIDLRDKLFLHRAVLAGASAQREPHGEYLWRAAGSDEAWRKHDFRSSEIAITCECPAVDLRIVPFGYMQEVLYGLSGSATVTLRPALVVVLELDTTGELPSYPYLFDPVLKQGDATVGLADGSPYFTAEKRSSRFLLSAAGRVRVGWHLERRGEGWAVGGGVLNAQEIEIDVLEIPGEQRFRVPLDPAAITALAKSPPF